MDQFNFVISIDKDFLDFIASMTGHLLSWPVAFVAAVLIFRKPAKALIERVRSVKGAGVDVELRDQLADAEFDALGAARQVTESTAGAGTAADPVVAPVGTDVARDKAESGDNADVSREGDGEPSSPSPRDSWPTFSSIRLPASWSGLEASFFQAADPQMPVRVLDDPRKQMLWSWSSLEEVLVELYDLAGIEKKLSRFQTGWSAALRLNEVGLLPTDFISSLFRLREILIKVNKGQAEISEADANDFSRTAWQLKRLAREAFPRARERARQAQLPIDWGEAPGDKAKD